MRIPLVTRLLWACLTLVVVLQPTLSLGQGTLPQTLTWTGADDLLLPLNTPHGLAATASSGLPVSLQVAYGPATLAGGNLTVHEPGAVAVVAEQAGDSTFAAIRETRVFNQRQAVLTPRGSRASANLTFDVAVSGDLAFLADWGAGVQIINVSNPDNPVRVGLFNTSGEALGVAVRDQWAYVADGPQGLQILDILDPAKPVAKGRFRTGGIAHRVQVLGTVAYVAAVTADLQVIDVSDPAAPVRLGVGSHAGDALGVKVVGNIAYVAAGNNGLHVFDVSNPATPVLLATLGGLGQASDVDVAGDRACVISSSGLHYIDVSDPAEPVRLGTASLFVPGAPFSGGVFAPGLPEVFGDVRIVGNLVYALNRASFLVVDFSSPAQPSRLGVLSTNTDGKGLQMVGSRAYFGDATTGLRIVDVHVGYPQILAWSGAAGSDLALQKPHPIGATSSSGLPVTLSVLAGPATLSNGLLTVTGPGTVTMAAEQVGDADFLPARVFRSFNNQAYQPREVGRLGFVDNTQPNSDVQVVGSRAYVLRIAGFDILDVADPTRPVLLGHYHVPVGANSDVWRALDVRNSTVFLSVGNRLEIVDAGDPANPGKIAERSVGSAALDILVSGDLAYVLTMDGFRILDVSEPANPVQRSIYKASGSLGFGRIKVSGNRACILGVNIGIEIVDVSNPTAPARQGAVSFPGKQLSGMDFEGDTVVVCVRKSTFPQTSGFEIFNVANPATPVRVGEYVEESSGFNARVQLVGDVLYRFASDAGPNGASLQIFDVAAPANPLFLGDNFQRFDYLAGQVVGEYLYTVNSWGLYVLRLERGVRQEFTWTGVADTLPLLGVGYPLAATASSGLPVTLRLEFGPATLVDGILTATGPGLVQVTAEQPGDTAHLPVKETHSFNARQFLPHPRGGVPVTGGGAQLLQVAGNRAYVVDDGQFDGDVFQDRSFRIFDVSDPDHPSLLGSLAQNGRIQTLRVIGHLAYLADFGEFDQDGILAGSALRVLDVADPSHPVQVGEYPTETGVLSMDITGDFVCLGDFEGMRVLNVSNPAKPAQIGGLAVPGGVDKVSVVGTVAYFQSGNADFVVADLANPVSPALLGSVVVGDQVHDLAVRGPFAYLLTGGAGVAPGLLVVVDVSQPARPTVVGRLPLSVSGRGLRVIGDTAYIAANESRANQNPGLLVVDILNPAVPVQLGFMKTQSSASGVDVVGNLAYLSVYGTGVEGLKVVEIGLSATGAMAPSLHIHRTGQLLELAWSTGLTGWKLQQRASFTSESDWQEVTASLMEIDGEVRATVNATEAAGYFRLIRP